jgi:hypothetical protein
MTFAHTTTLYLWFKLLKCINNEDDARCYESCTDRLYKLVYDEGEANLYNWWAGFWCMVGMKYPNVAVDHISQFLREVIDRKEIRLIQIVNVSFE